MLRIVRQWIRQHREWMADHRKSWAGAGDAGPDGLSAFQRQCMEAVRRTLSSRGMSLANERIEGETERYVVAGVPDLGAELWVYLDGACATSPLGEMRLEEWDTRSPDEMCDRVAEFFRTLPPSGAPPNTAVQPTRAAGPNEQREPAGSGPRG